MALESDDPDARMNINYLLGAPRRAGRPAGGGWRDGLHRGAAPTLCWPATWRCTNGSPSSPSAATSPTCCGTQAQVVLLGGLFQHQSESGGGLPTRLCIEQVHFPPSSGGRLTPRDELTSRDMMRADVVNSVLAGGRPMVSHHRQQQVRRHPPSPSARRGRSAWSPTMPCPPPMRAALAVRGITLHCVAA